MTGLTGVIDEIDVWVDRVLATSCGTPIGAAATASWCGHISADPMLVRVDVGGIGSATYHVAIRVDDLPAVDTDRALRDGRDVYKASV